MAVSHVDGPMRHPSAQLYTIPAPWNGDVLRPCPAADAPPPNPTREPGIRGHFTASELIWQRKQTTAKRWRLCVFVPFSSRAKLTYMIDLSYITNTRHTGYVAGNKWNRSQIYVHRNCPSEPHPPWIPVIRNGRLSCQTFFHHFYSILTSSFRER